MTIQEIDALAEEKGYSLIMRKPEGDCPWGDGWGDEKGYGPENTIILRNQLNPGYTNGWNLFGSIEQAVEYLWYTNQRKNTVWI